MFTNTLICLLVLSAFGYFFGSRRVMAKANAQGTRSHSRPSYHGLFVALWTGLPALVLVMLWLAVKGPLIDQLVLASLPESFTQGAGSGQMQLYLGKIKQIAVGQVFGEPDPVLVEAAERMDAWRAMADNATLFGGAGIAAGALALSMRRIGPWFRARPRVERIVTGILIFCSVVAILTTIGIILSLFIEALRFFAKVPWYEFLFGLNWEPQISIREDQVAGAGAFGAIPVFTGTLLVALVAMLIAGPIGLLSAIYLSEYANEKVRKVVKPIMELLSGIPTVVYGFFAVLIVAPALSDLGSALGLDIAPNSAFAAGAVMGIMILPFVSSLSDDALRSVPNAMREGSYAMGATQAETIRQVLIAAALPGIVGGFLLAVSRAIGETMIVVMAAGLIANLTANPFEAVTTVTVQIVTLLIGDTSFDNPKTLAAFALGITLFVLTLCLNVIALRIVQKYRERYE